MTELTPQGVSGIRRISFSKYVRRIPTNTLELTFNNPKLPPTIRLGYLIVKIQIYIPNQLRCFDCQTFGHNESSCTNNIICGRCSEPAHTPNFECDADPKCLNCSGPHESRFKDWKFEKEVLKIKYTRNISFPEARKLTKEKCTSISSKLTYATIAQSYISVYQDSSTQYDIPSGDQVSEI